MKFFVKKYLILLLTTLILISSCQLIFPKSSPSSLKIAYSPWPGYLPLILAQEKGFFKDQKVNVDLIYSEDTHLQASEFLAGKYDANFQDLGTLLIMAEKNPKISIILVNDESVGADAVIADSSINKIGDLQGKAVSTDISGFGELFLTKMLETVSLTPDDINLVNMPQEKVPELIKQGKIQAGHTWEPYVTRGLKDGAKVIFTSLQTPGLIYDALAFHHSVLEQNSEGIRRFLQAWFQAVDYWQKFPEESVKIVSEYLKIPADEVKIKGVKLLNFEENLKAFTPGETSRSLFQISEVYIKFFIRRGNLSRSPDLDKFIDASFLQSLKFQR